MKKAGKRTGPKPRFSEEDAICAALELGLDSFTLASVANRLGVGTSSLYRVISSREDLIRMCLQHIFKQFYWSPEAPAWEAQLLEAAHSLWTLMERYPGLDYTLIDTPGAFLYFQDFLHPLKNRLLQGGFPGDQQRIEFALDFIFDTTLTSHYQLVAVRRDFSKIKEAALAESRFFTPDDSWLSRGWLDRKLAFIIAGLKTNLDSQ